MNSTIGWPVFGIGEPLRGSSLELSDLASAMAVTSSRLAKALAKMRLAYGSGYRIYYKQMGKTIVLILCGGDKSSQDEDIKRAKQIAAQL